MKARSTVLLADESGLGKSVQAVSALTAHPARAPRLVVCPQYKYGLPSFVFLSSRQCQISWLCGRSDS